MWKILPGHHAGSTEKRCHLVSGSMIGSRSNKADRANTREAVSDPGNRTHLPTGKNGRSRVRTQWKENLVRTFTGDKSPISCFSFLFKEKRRKHDGKEKKEENERKSKTGAPFPVFPRFSSHIKKEREKKKNVF